MELACYLGDALDQLVRGTLTLGQEGLEFRPDGAMGPRGEVRLARDQIRAATLASIGRRSSRGPFLELSVYPADVSRVFTFIEIENSKGQELRAHFVDVFGVTPKTRTFEARGWNWGRPVVSSSAVTFCASKFGERQAAGKTAQTDPALASLEAEAAADAIDAAEDAAEAAGGAPAQEGGAGPADSADDINEAPVEAEIFHLSTAMILDYKTVGTKDLSFTLRVPANTRKTVVREITFTAPDRAAQEALSAKISRVVDISGSDRILSIQNVTVFTTKSTRFAIEFLTNSIRFYSGSQDYRIPKSAILRCLFVEKQNDNSTAYEYYLVVFFGAGKGLGPDGDVICISLGNRQVSSVCNVPGATLDETLVVADENVYNTFIRAMCCPLYFQRRGDAVSEAEISSSGLVTVPRHPEGDVISEFPTSCFIELTANSFDKKQTTVRGVEEWVLIPRLFQYYMMGTSSQMIFSKQGQAEYYFTADAGARGEGSRFNNLSCRDPSQAGRSSVSYVECTYHPVRQKTKQRQACLYFLDPRIGILLAPFDPRLIKYPEVRRISIDPQPNIDGRVMLTLVTERGSYEFLDIKASYATEVHSYLSDVARVPVTLNVWEGQADAGGLAALDLSESENDEDFAPSAAGSESSRDFSLSTVGSVMSEDSVQAVTDEEEVSPKPETKKRTRRPPIVLPSAKPEDALLGEQTLAEMMAKASPADL